MAERSNQKEPKIFFNIMSGTGRQYFLTVVITLITASFCFLLKEIIGYQVVSFVLLCVVSILALFFETGPMLLSAILNAVVWDFFFIPPPFTFHIDKSVDMLMLIMFFIIAIISGVLTSRIKRQEMKIRTREERMAREAYILSESDKLYKTLFNSISHELRIPLATIMGVAESLMTNEHLPEIRKELLSEVYIASKRLNRLIENLLNMSRLESGRISPRFDWYDIHDLINKVTESLQEELRPFNLQVVIPGEMPLVKIDFGLIEQTLYNLVYNATQYASNFTNLRIKAFYDDGFLIIQVMDRGPGISPNEISLIFNKFYRVEGSKTGGTGLGLSIAKGFTEAHKGTISVENRQNGGAKFTIKIPSQLPDFAVKI